MIILSLSRSPRPQDEVPRFLRPAGLLGYDLDRSRVVGSTIGDRPEAIPPRADHVLRASIAVDGRGSNFAASRVPAADLNNNVDVIGPALVSMRWHHQQCAASTKVCAHGSHQLQRVDGLSEDRRRAMADEGLSVSC